MNHQESLTAYLVAFVAELVQTGIKDVVVSPGSRSTPMAMVMAEHPEINIHIHVDERSAAFFALGIAKATNKPVAFYVHLEQLRLTIFLQSSKPVIHVFRYLF